MVRLPLLPTQFDEPAAGFGLRLTTIHWGYPAGTGGTPPGDAVASVLFRWNRPLAVEDCRSGVIGGRSTMWHPGRTVSSGDFGLDGRDFTGQRQLEED